jgi:uncharacterized protein (TIGR02145 family)
MYIKKMNSNQFNLRAINVLLLFLAILQTGCNKEESPENIPVIITNEITGIMINSALSGGTITTDQGAEVIFRGVCWSTNPNPTIADNKTIDGTGAGNFKSSITGLSTNTTYYVRAYATNTNGTGYGSTMSFTTLASQFIDSRDGTVYQIVEIGNQIWMAENLKYLPSVIGPNAVSLATPYYYVFGYSGTNVEAAKATVNYSTYGVLYNWPAAINACPSGWHLPSDADWTELTDYLGGASVAGGKLKATGTTYWDNPNAGATNEIGFTALPGGFKFYDGTLFYNIRLIGCWWSNTKEIEYSAYYWYMTYDLSHISKKYNYLSLGYSVRCVKD